MLRRFVTLEEFRVTILNLTMQQLSVLRLLEQGDDQKASN
jgi:hypothetical protein